MTSTSRAASVPQLRRQLAALVARASSDADVVAAIAELRELLADLGDRIDVRDYGAAVDGVTNDRAAVQAVVDALAAAGGGTVYFPEGVCLIATAIQAKSGVRFLGDGCGVSILQTSDAGVAVIGDANAATDGVEVRGLQLKAMAAATVPSVYFQHASTANLVIEDNAFTRGDIGVAVIGGTNIRVAGNRFSALLTTGVQIGGSAALAADFAVEGNRFTSIGGAASGNPIQVQGDRGVVANNVLNDSGSTTVGTSLYHGIYLRRCQDVAVTGNVVIGQKHGACLHIFSDTGGGERKGARITVAGNVFKGSTTYVGIRADQVDHLVVQGNTIARNQLNGLYLSNCDAAAVTGNSFDSNNIAAGSGATNGSAIRAATCAQLSLVGNVAQDSVATTYGQGGLARLETVTRSLIHGNVFRFHNTANGYYLVDLSGTCDTITIAGNVMHYASTLVNGDLTDGAIVGNACYNNGNSAITTGTTPLPYNNLVIRNNINQGAPMRRESDGVNEIDWGAAAPASGARIVGDIRWNTAPAAGGAPGWVCTAAGTPGTWKAMAAVAA